MLSAVETDWNVLNHISPVLRNDISFLCHAVARNFLCYFTVAEMKEAQDSSTKSKLWACFQSALVSWIMERSYLRQELQSKRMKLR